MTVRAEPTAPPPAPAGRASRWPKALRSKDFRLWYAGQALSVIGSEMVPVALTFAVLSRYRSAGAVGTVLTAQSAPLVAMLLVGGVLADRVSRRVLLLATDVVSAASQAVAAALLLWGGWHLWELALAFAFQGASTGLGSPALIGMVTDTVPEEDRPQANTLRSLASSVGQVAGPAIAGLVAGLGGGGLALSLNAGSYAASALCLALMSRTAPPEPRDHGFVADLREGWHEFRSRTWLWSVIGQFGLFHLLVYPPVIVLGALVTKEHLGGASAWGLTLGAFGVGSIAGGLLMLRWKLRHPLFVGVAACATFSLWAAALALRLPLGWQVVAAGVAGAFIAIFDVAWNTALTTHVPADKLSRVSAYDWFGSVALLPIGFAVIGPLSSALGVRTTLWAAAALWLVICALVLAVRDVRTMT